MTKPYSHSEPNFWQTTVLITAAICEVRSIIVFRARANIVRSFAPLFGAPLAARRVRTVK